MFNYHDEQAAPARWTFRRSRVDDDHRYPLLGTFAEHGACRNARVVEAFDPNDALPVAHRAQPHAAAKSPMGNDGSVSYVGTSDGSGTPG